MKHFYFVTLAFFAILSSVEAQDSIPTDVLGSIKSDDLKRIVYKLASPEMEGRGLKTDGIVKASEFISNSFISYGIGYIVPLKGYFQKVDYISTQYNKPVFKIGKMNCIENYSYLGNLPTVGNNRNFDIVVIKNLSLDYIQSVDLNNKVVLILAKDIFFNKKPLYNLLKKKGCNSVLLCNPYDKKQFSSLREIYKTTNLLKLNKYKESFSGSIVTTDSLIKSLKTNSFFISTVVLHPRVVTSLLNTSLKKLVKQLETDLIDSSIKRTYPLTLSITTSFVKNLEASNNVLGYIEGSEFPNEVIVISAHYDHLGIEEGKIMYGADDNASGVAAVIEIAKAYSKAVEMGFRPKRSIVFAAFSGEEKGLWGSNVFVNQSDSLNIKPVLNLNMDMIGRGEDTHIEKNRPFKKVYAIAHKRDSLLSKQIRLNTFNSDSLFISYSSNDIYSSDQASFIAAKIPAVMFFRGLHSDYHTQGDTPDKLDYQTLERITKLVFRVSWQYVK